jgi:hypothetical protein
MHTVLLCWAYELEFSYLTVHIYSLRNSFQVNLYTQSQHKLRTETQYQSHQSLVAVQETSIHVSHSSAQPCFERGVGWQHNSLQTNGHKRTILFSVDLQYM